MAQVSPPNSFDPEQAVRDRYSQGAVAVERDLCCPAGYDPKLVERSSGMKSWRMRFIAIGCVAAGLTGALFFRGADQTRAQSSDSADFRVGQTFPTTVFPSLDGGHPRSVADFRGKKLILHIFASW